MKLKVKTQSGNRNMMHATIRYQRLQKAILFGLSELPD
jgi:hypothetical protein